LSQSKDLEDMVEVGESKDLDLLMCYKGKWQRNHGLSQSKDLGFNSE